MKKLFTLLCVIAIATSTYGQGVDIGIKGGLNFPSLDGFSIPDGADLNADSRSGYHAGAFVRLKIPVVSIQGEVLYSFQKFEYSFDAPLLDQVNSTQRINYLTVPIIARIKPIPLVNLQVGPQFGFLLSSVQELEIDGEIEEGDIDEFVKGSDIGLNLGAGIDLPFGLDIHARYIIGLTDVNDSDQAEEAKNSMFQVSVGYALFRLGKK